MEVSTLDLLKFTDVLTGMIVQTTLCANNPFQLMQINYGQTVLGEWLKNLVAAQVGIVEIMCLVTMGQTTLVELPQLDQIVRCLLFNKYVGLSRIAKYLFFAICLLALVNSTYELFAPFLLWQLVYSECDVLLSSIDELHDIESFPVLLIAIAVSPVLARIRLEQLLADGSICSNIQQFLVKVNKFISLALLLYGISLTVLKAHVVHQLTSGENGRIKSFGAASFHVPVMLFWGSVSCNWICGGENLWFLLVMQSSMQTAACIFVEEIRERRYRQLFLIENNQQRAAVGQNVGIVANEDQIVFVDSLDIID